MKKIITVIFFLTVIQSAGYAQDLNAASGWRDSALHNLDTARQDTSRVLLTAELASYYKFYLPDSALFYAYKALSLSRQIKFPKGEVRALRWIAMVNDVLGNDSKALQTSLQGLKIAEKNNLSYDKALLLGGLADIYNSLKNHARALDLARQSKAIFDSLHNFTLSAACQSGVGETYLLLNQPDSAFYYCQSAYENAVKLNAEWVIYNALLNLGRIEEKKGNNSVALAYFRQSLSVEGDANSIFNSYFSIAELYQQMNKSDSGIYYAKKALETVKGRGFYSNIIKANVLLSSIYEKSNPQKALQHSKMAIAYKDSLDNLGKTTSIESLIAFDEQERQYEIETAKAAYRSKVKQYGLIGGLLVFLLIGFILYRTKKIRMQHEIVLQKNKASELEMQALRAQMNPHFIFNSLNSINLFILQKQSVEAADYLTKFSRLIRMILNSSANASVSLAEDLEALQLYLELESLRFEKKFTYKIEHPPEIDADFIQVPPMLLQPFVENAIWHGLRHKRGEGHLWINIRQENSTLICTIKDDGIGRKKAAELKDKSVKQKSMGMKITESRIAMMQKLNGEDKSFEIKDLVCADGNAAGTEVVLRIPVV